MAAIVVNLFGAPGSGKTTGAAYIFAELKKRDINAELVTEFAKDMVWEENKTAFDNQFYITGMQSYRLSRCVDKVDVIITDSPLPLGIIYNKNDILGDIFNQLVMNVFKSYNNMNFLICRTKRYNPIGRNETESESDEIFYKICDLLAAEDIGYEAEPGAAAGYDDIVKKVMMRLNEIDRLKAELV